MTLTPAGDPQHTGEERFEIELQYDSDDLIDIGKLSRVGDVMPDKIFLVWVRPVGGQWRRYSSGRSGSRAEGRVRLPENASPGLQGRRRAKEIFTPLGELKSWAVILPHLRPAIDRAEMELPE